MPFIRYEQGDIARNSNRRPSCGRGLPLMEEVRGRAGDFIILRSGRKLTPHPFFLVLDHAVGVGRWQIVQETIDHISVAVTMQEGPTDGVLDSIRQAIGRLVDDGTTVDVKVVESLRNDDPRSKLRSVVSKLPEGHTPGKRES
jgi:phenylacetate-CoA ligase